MDTSSANFVTRRHGSALILAVVLTSLLAIVGAMFLMSQRVEKMGATALSESKEIEPAIDSVVALIADELARDVPAGDPNVEYYDYPGTRDIWLASLEPELDPETAGTYRWRQISDVTGYLARRESETTTGWGYTDPVTENSRQWVNVGIVDEYPVLTTNADDELNEIWADADGDGVADAKWIEVESYDAISGEMKPLTTGSGEPIYAAIRVVDNGGMLNVNTATVFDSNSKEERFIDGHSQAQVNLKGFLEDTRDVADIEVLTGESADKLKGKFGDQAVEDYSSLRNRWALFPEDNNDLKVCPFMLYDIADELELRNRFCLNNAATVTRLENLLEKSEQDTSGDNEVTYNFNTSWTPFDNHNIWGERVSSRLEYEYDKLNESKYFDKKHLLTTYNCDRVIDPNGDMMFWINAEDANAQELFDYKLAKLVSSEDPDAEALDSEFAQVAANIVDFRDEEEVVSIVEDSDGGIHYGFERPLIYISELTYKFVKESYRPGSGPIGAPLLYRVYRSYGVEIMTHSGKAYDEQFGRWRVKIDTDGNGDIDETIVLDDSRRSGRYYVALFNDPNADMYDLVKFIDSPENGDTKIDPDVILSWDEFPDYRMGAGQSAADWNYELYIGTDYNSVKDSNSSEIVPPGSDTIRYAPISYGNTALDPFDPVTGLPSLSLGTTYYWRVDDFCGGELVEEGPVWSFTTWETEPNLIEDVRDSNDLPVIDSNTIIYLERPVRDGEYVIADYVDCGVVDANWVVSDDDIPDRYFNAATEGVVRSYQRDIHRKQTIRSLWDFTLSEIDWPTLGHRNAYNYSTLYPDDKTTIQTPISDGRFANVGEIGWVFNRPVYGEAACVNRYEAAASGTPYVEGDLRIDLTDPNYQQLFQWMTVMCPAADGVNNDGDAAEDEPDEIKVAGRININTAPWYVIAQLPWVSQELARGIVAYRDKVDISGDVDGPDYWRSGDAESRKLETGNYWPLREVEGFASIGELTTVVNGDSGKRGFNMGKLALDDVDQTGFPDLRIYSRTRRDGATDDLEERHMIFARISDLVTVRSDVFTAYILVRVGLDGPQRRAIAILDRSDVGRYGTGKVKVRSLWMVPDAR